MKITILSHYFKPHIGGIEVVAEAHAKRLASRGHDVVVFTTDIGAKNIQESNEEYKILRYSGYNPLEKWGIPYPIPNLIDCVMTVRSAIDDVDILHVHGINYLTSLFPLAVVDTEDTAVLLHQHTPFVDYSPLLNIVENINDNIVGRLVLKSADLCIAVDRDIKKYMCGLGAESVSILHNSVDIGRFSPEIEPTANEFLYLGRLTQKKGIKRLMKAIEILDQRDNNLTIRIAGNGGMSKTIEMMANSTEKLEYEGIVTSERLPELYSRARAVLLPEMGGDAFPTLTALEALASGTPSILVKDNISAPGFVEGEVYLNAEPTSNSLANIVCRLSDSDALVKEMETKCRNTAIEWYEWSSHIDQLENIYREMLTSTEFS